MKNSTRRYRLLELIILGIFMLAVAACAPPTVKKPRSSLSADGGEKIDFSGHWELDYQLSDDLQDRLRQIFLLARLEAEREAARRSMGQRVSPTITTARNSYAGIIDLGRFAESITRTTILQIEQTDEFIQILRENDFSLVCGFHDGAARPVKDLLGTEMCGWDVQQLVFFVSLEEGITVNHRLTMGPDGQRLNIATTVRSRLYPSAFTFNRVYQRFTPLESEFECELTLDRGRSCRRVESK